MVHVQSSPARQAPTPHLLFEHSHFPFQCIQPAAAAAPTAASTCTRASSRALCLRAALPRLPPAGRCCWLLLAAAAAAGLCRLLLVLLLLHPLELHVQQLVLPPERFDLCCHPLHLSRAGARAEVYRAALPRHLAHAARHDGRTHQGRVRALLTHALVAAAASHQPVILCVVGISIPELLVVADSPTQRLTLCVSSALAARHPQHGRPSSAGDAARLAPAAAAAPAPAAARALGHRLAVVLLTDRLLLPRSHAATAAEGATTQLAAASVAPAAATAAGSGRSRRSCCRRAV